MKKINIILIAALVIIVALGFFAQQVSREASLGAPVNEVTLCPPKGCKIFEYDPEYLAESGRLIGKVNANEPLEYDEFQLLVEMYDYEAKKRGGLVLSGVNLQDGRGFIGKLNQEITK